MVEPPMKVSKEDLTDIEKSIGIVREMGTEIRQALESYADEDLHDTAWEVQAGVEALEVFGSRWTIEILAALYVAGERRFNELRHLLNRISSRTLSDKLKACTESGLVERRVVDGPPVRVSYRLTEHGKVCGRLLGPLVAYMKIRNGAIIENV
ncbi:MAG TPA: helix-turn-helix domain-containing protein [Candidatus Thalassarchaeaceae archaeon]|nr:helix-turn-helix domain-containing protein [Candidatus Thalassarchaeaceae archaeon]